MTTTKTRTPHYVSLVGSSTIGLALCSQYELQITGAVTVAIHCKWKPSIVAQYTPLYETETQQPDGEKLGKDQLYGKNTVMEYSVSSVRAKQDHLNFSRKQIAEGESQFTTRHE